MSEQVGILVIWAGAAVFLVGVVIFMKAISRRQDRVIEEMMRMELRGRTKPKDTPTP